MITRHQMKKITTAGVSDAPIVSPKKNICKKNDATQVLGINDQSSEDKLHEQESDDDRVVEPPPAKGEPESHSTKMTKLPALPKPKEEGAWIYTSYLPLPDEVEE